MKVRRVVTGTTADGPRFVSDEQVGAVRPPLLGNDIVRLWGWDATPELPFSGEPLPQSAQFFPPPGALRVVLWSLPPHGSVELPGEADYANARAEMDLMVPGMADIEYGEHGLHATRSVDFQYIVSGEVEFGLEDGASTVLRAGDLIVVGGIPHSWSNRSGEPCVFFGVLAGSA